MPIEKQSASAALGNDGNNGISAPKATIGAAIGAAVSGDTIKVEAGTYNELPTTYSLDGKDLALVPAGNVTLQ